MFRCLFIPVSQPAYFIEQLITHRMPESLRYELKNELLPVEIDPIIGSSEYQINLYANNQGSDDECGNALNRVLKNYNINIYGTAVITFSDMTTYEDVSIPKSLGYEKVLSLLKKAMI